ncbi:LysM peptidoglycan-binding domain-containing protein [Mahella australiensis]|uniref:Peptidoglycan-binding lysin domain protein n=1 Tax=Mahella australiensis (strain DSM 15567 / CIP 107919 / 50-1 BON) TaxID=697281 RepID=F3ZZX2_MAHA5|nr:LysM peptidoglycan-binding domain-containing protein [Mahella australiensis]AEE95790.1 Peptidoglycan-binding lysin domain protein [Mahella australiensis 50-1 BON]
MDFYLINTANNETFRFPVNPEEMQVQSEKDIETVEIYQLGEIDFPQGEKRTNISFSSFLPLQYDTYCQYTNVPKPVEAINKLDAWRKAGKPLRLLITDTPINTLVIISTLSWSTKGGEVGDIYFDIAFRSWQDVKVRTVAISKAPAKKRPDTKPVPKIYVVKSGDSLWKIAKTQLGSGSKWTAIYNIPENKKTIGSNPNRIYPGQRLVMPA